MSESFEAQARPGEAREASIAGPVRGEDQVLEGRRAVEAAAAFGVILRLLGGVAVRATCPSSARPPFARESADIDFAAGGGGRGGVQAADVEKALASEGWEPDRSFNLYNGETRLVFRKRGVKADVFLGSFRMCHAIPLDGRLGSDPLALPLAELLLTKLQVVEADEKDLVDAACILADHELGPSDWPRINEVAFGTACGADWGLWRTVRGSLARLGAWATEARIGGESAALVASRLARLERLLESAPKSIAWKARAFVGDRLRWYELPEEGAE